MLSLEELQNSKAPIHGGGDPRNLTPEQFAAADTDGDGVVSAAEYHDSFFTTHRAQEEEEEGEAEEEGEEEVVAEEGTGGDDRGGAAEEEQDEIARAIARAEVEASWAAV